ncbi:MAG: STAS domain-containing protein [Acidobacteriota bacterium]
MATHITQTESEEGGCVTLRVDGEMLLDDALLVERLVRGIRSERPREVVIDLADLDFLDSDSAGVLRGLANEAGIRIEGIEIFLQSVINDVEKR